MQVETLIRLIENQYRFKELIGLPEFQRFLRMNYKSPITNGKIDTLLKSAQEKLGVEIKFNESMGSLKLYSFSVNGMLHRNRISHWENIVDAKINALIYLSGLRDALNKTTEQL